MRKRVFYLWTITDGGCIAVDGVDGKTPYLWATRDDAKYNSYVGETVQLVKVTVEPVKVASSDARRARKHQ